MAEFFSLPQIPFNSSSKSLLKSIFVAFNTFSLPLILSVVYNIFIWDKPFQHFSEVTHTFLWPLSSIPAKESAFSKISSSPFFVFLGLAFLRHVCPKWLRYWSTCTSYSSPRTPPWWRSTPLPRTPQETSSAWTQSSDSTTTQNSDKRPSLIR